MDLNRFSRSNDQPKGDPLTMLPEEKRMELFEVYDVTKSYVQTANLCGVDPKTVRKAIAVREAGNDTRTRKPRDTSYDPYVEKITEWVERSSGKVRVRGSLG